MIKVVSFDLDGTLVDKNFDELLWFKEIPEAYAKKNRISIKKAKEIVFSEYDKKEKELHYRWTDIGFWADYFGLGDWQRIVDRIKDRIAVYPDVVETLKELKKRHKLIIITQSDPKMIKYKIKTEGIEKYFSMIVSVPGEFKQLKKDKKVFNEITRKLDIRKEMIVHIGDNYALDYELPRKAGIRAFYLDRSGKANGEDVVYSLTGFLDIIKDIENKRY